MKYNILDFHAHVFPDEIAPKATDQLRRHYGYTPEEDGTLGSLKKSMANAGVGQCVLLSSATRSGQVRSINNYIASLVKQGFIGFGTVHPNGEDIEGEILRILALGLRGIKLHPEFQGFPIDAEPAYEIYRRAEGVLPILMHMGDEKSDFSSPRRLAKVLDAFPRLTVVAAHFGGYCAWDEAEEQLAGRAGLFLDTSSSLFRMPREQAIRIIKKHKAKNCLFGTDYPMAAHSGAVDEFLSLGLSESENADILGENARRLLRL